MNRSTALASKLIYLAVLVAMLVPLYLLGQPASGGGDSGGRLTEMRVKYNMAESELGEISPASETMKLVSLGLRGPAASMLWDKAHKYKVQHEWDRLKATLNNIALLQPHFDKVWEHQAHNLAYNVSTEFDDYRQRYEMVREGTEFLTRGVRQNRNAPRLIWYTGWFYGSKMGTSDEKVQFRRLFSDDEVLHESLLDEGIAVDSPEARGPYGKPDNWLVGRLWLNYGYDLVDSGVKIRRQTPLNFFETGPKWRLKHAEAIEREGVLDDRAMNAWDQASSDWEGLGQRSIPTTAAFTIKLGQLDELGLQIDEKMEAFRELTGEAYDRAEQELIDAMAEDVRAIWEKPRSELTEHEEEIFPSIEASVIPDFNKVTSTADPAVRLRARILVGEIKDLQDRRRKTDGMRNQVNYEYWNVLALAEQEERTVNARKLIYDAEKANADAELDKAIELYEQAFVIWAEIFDDYPMLTVDDTAEDLAQSIRRYTIANDTEELPEDFPLAAFIEMMGSQGRVGSSQYASIRRRQKERLEQRRQELEAEQRSREAGGEPGDGEKEGAEKDAAENKGPEKDDAKTDDAKTDDAKKDEADNKGPEKDDADDSDAESTTKASTSEEDASPKGEAADESGPDSDEAPADEPESENPASESPESESETVKEPATDQQQ